MARGAHCSASALTLTVCAVGVITAICAFSSANVLTLWDPAFLTVGLSPPGARRNHEAILQTYAVTRWHGAWRYHNYWERVPPLPQLYSQFDWMFHRACNWTRGDDPRTVWVMPELDYLRVLLHELTQRRVPRAPQQRVLVCASSDRHYTEVADAVRALRPWFSRIFY